LVEDPATSRETDEQRRVLAVLTSFKARYAART
jgi:hypothetical protein